MIKANCTPEVIARRNEQKRINDEKAKAFIPQAEAEFAKLFGVEALNEIQKKALAEQIFSKARILMFAAEKGTTRTVTPRGTKAQKLSQKFVGMLARAFGYAIHNGIDAKTWGALLDEASKNPIKPVVRAKAEERKVEGIATTAPQVML